MNDSLFVFGTILITTALIYFFYRIILVSENKNKESDLQITSNEIIEQLTILHKQRKYSIVENLAKKYLEKKNNDFGVRSILAKALFESGRIYEAIEQIKILVRQQPYNSNIRLLLANCYIRVDSKMEAINVLQDLLENDASNVFAIKELAEIYVDTNQKKSAIKMYERLDEFLENNNDKAKNNMTIAELHADYNDFHLAIPKYEQVLEIYPDHINAKKRLIELYKMIADYDTVIELAGELSTIYTIEEVGLWASKTLLDAYNATQNYDKALEMAEKIKTHPLANTTEVGEDLAKILLNKNQIDESISLLKELISQNPKNISLKKDLAFGYTKKHDFEAAIHIYKKILDEAELKEINSIHFEISNLYANWAIYLFSQGHSDECFKNFIIALQYNSQNPDIYYQIAEINKTIKNFNEAIAQYKKALDIDPSKINCYYALSECYEEIDSIYEQKRILLDSLKYNTENSVVHYKLGAIHQLQNDLNSAKSSLKRAIELDENYIEPKYKLALIYEHLGETEEAVSLYEDILFVNPQHQDAMSNLRMIKA